ncbi:2868_t:CDS:2 [Paraglomus brasilianum]|uniref:Glutaredoxin-like protein n=1 Tax=Paraglomus brasilianum TaxID=144538 RepID=A0A9N8ZB08_9GLOM|nr:2868_t:CDS:2 [Paraglomus brasilianum]
MSVPSRRILLTLFTSKNCSLCEEAKIVLERVRHKIPFELEQKDIRAPGNEKWFEEYKYDIPVLHLNGSFLLEHRINEETLEKTLTKFNSDGVVE